MITGKNLLLLLLLLVMLMDLYLDIYNIRGQKVKTLLNEHKEAGKHNIIWEGIDDNGKKVSSGVYFYKIKNGKFTATKKMILMK